MSLLSDIEAQAKRPGTICSVRSVLATIATTDADELRDALTRKDADGTYHYTGAQIARFLQDDLALECGDQAINRHRAGKCQCR